MIRYICHRIALIIPVLLGVTFLIFAIMYFSPGNPEEYILGDMATAEDKALFREQHHLDDSFIIQFAHYIGGLFRGDLGTSYVTQLPVLDELVVRFAVTVKLACAAILIASVFGVTLGVISAVKQYSFIDNFARILAMVGVSMPAFWQGLMLILLFSVRLGVLPSSGITSWKGWILPAFTLGTVALATIMRIARSCMLEEIRQDYVVTARAKGQKEMLVITKHALQNAFLPILTVIGTNFSRLMGGAAVVETVFAVPGIGKLLVDAILVKNIPLVQGGVIFIAFFMTFINLGVDIIYAFVDPRIRTQYSSRKNKQNRRKEGEFV